MSSPVQRITAAPRRRLWRLAVGAGIALSSLAAALPAQAEGRLRIAEQFGVVYLLLNVAQEQQLIEKHGRKLGVDITVEHARLSGGSAVNDALLSGSIDIAAAGVGPLLTLWDRTHGKQNVRAIASLGNFPTYLVSTNPAVKTIADLSEKDRIALPAVTVSVQARLLQMAAAKQWGDAEYKRLDKYTQSLPHPDATAAIISGGTEINGHFANPPYQDEELSRNPNARIVTTSYDILGGPASSTLLYATEKFKKENPKTYQAFVDALAEAAQFAAAHPEAAADIYLRVSKNKVDRELVLKVIRNPQVQFTTVPHNTFKFAQFLHRVGAIRNEPKRWQDYFFADAGDAEGS